MACQWFPKCSCPTPSECVRKAYRHRLTSRIVDIVGYGAEGRTIVYRPRDTEIAMRVRADVFHQNYERACPMEIEAEAGQAAGKKFAYREGMYG